MKFNTITNGALRCTLFLCIFISVSTRAAETPITQVEVVSYVESLVHTLDISKTTLERKPALNKFFEIQRHPDIFRHCLELERAKVALRLVKSTDSQTRYIGVFLTLLSDKEYPPETFATLMEAFDPEAGKDSAKLLVSVGFLAPVKLDNKQLEDLLKGIPRHQTDVQASLLSIYWRSGGSLEPINAPAIAPDKALAWPDESYVNAFTHKRSSIGLLPSDWKRIWLANDTPTQSSLRYKILESVEVQPSVPEAQWIIEQGIQIDGFRPDVLNLLWQNRRLFKNGAKPDGLHEWLTKLSSEHSNLRDTTLNDRIAAAGLLHVIFNEPRPFKDLVNGFKDHSDQSLNHWTHLTEVLLECDQSNVLLDELRVALLAPTSQEKLQPGAKWYVWLLDCRRGIKVDAPPLESLIEVLRTEAAAQTIAALQDSDDKMYPWLDSLRDPYVFLFGSGSSSRVIMQYLGTLDRLELAKREAAKKRN